MKLQNPLLTFLLIISIFSNSCSKEDVQVNAPPLKPSPVNPPPVNPPPPIPARNTINTQLTTVGNLSQARSDIAVASAGNKILFAGGTISPGNYSSRVDIFDVTTNTWTTAELSQPRTGVATAVLDKKIYFAGGKGGINSTIFSSRVDIYNTETNTWDATELGYVEALLSGAAANNKVVFAGGVTAHIYNTSTNTWSTAPLSDRPGSWGPSVDGIAATVIGNTIYFAGGSDSWDVHKAIDIYNTTTNSWSTSSLGEHKGGAAGIAVNNTNYWAGGLTWTGSGYVLSSFVEIWNMTSGSFAFGYLFQGNASFSAVQKRDTIVFFTGSGVVKDKFDIYDIQSNNWLIGVLPVNIEGAGIISVNNTIYVAGGRANGVLSNQLRKLEF